MRLETMRPNPTWSADAYADAVDAFADRADRIVVKVWCGDWCPDCRSQLPDFAAALDAAGVPADRIVQRPVEKLDDGSKTGPGVEAYDVERIPTVVVERAPDGVGDDSATPAGEELARFVEEAPQPIAVNLADQLRETPTV